MLVHMPLHLNLHVISNSSVLNLQTEPHHSTVLRGSVVYQQRVDWMGSQLRHFAHSDKRLSRKEKDNAKY